MTIAAIRHAAALPLIPAKTATVAEADMDFQASHTALRVLLADFRQRLIEADRQVLARRGRMPAALAQQLPAMLTRFAARLNELLGEGSGLNTEQADALGELVHAELLPWLSMADTADRFYAKPRGYAGDSYTIERIYQNQPSGSGRLGALLDQSFLAQPAAVAVRNRRELLQGMILDTLQQHGSGPVRVMSLACGPAAELFDTYACLPEPGRLRSTLLDIDPQALQFVQDKARHTGLEPWISALRGNLLLLAAGRQRLPALPLQQLIYSIGLIDYFDDAQVIALMNLAHQWLAPGGKLVLGNFHPANPTRALMDHVLHWRLIHRSEADMHRLYQASHFGKPASRIVFEAQGVNLFAECEKKS